MPSAKSILDLKSLSKNQITTLFSRAQDLLHAPDLLPYQGQTAALLFFEPSTRTKMSFLTAAHRCGLGPLLLDGVAGSSLEKGETKEDTILNIAAMRPSIMVIRCQDDLDLSEISNLIDMPIINAGWGKKGHPTQALLDSMTLWQEFKDLQGLKILFVGDVKHSRVVASHFELLETLGAEIGLSGPESFLVDRPGVQLFRRIEDGLEWCDAVMCLRVQLERHQSTSGNFSLKDYRSDYALTQRRLHHLRSHGVILHPGPINFGVEMDIEVRNDSRHRIFRQVTNGVVIREALIRLILEGRL